MSREALAVLKGEILHGQGRGRGLGFPTANIRLSFAGSIPLGVYFSCVVAEDGKRHFAVTNVGVHPTVGSLEKPVAEAHLLGVAEDLYGRVIEIELISFLRPEQEFSSVEELKAQVKKDIERARTLANEKSV